MTSLKQIEANRRNARKSTGPATQVGKQRSRCNAVRHGLSAETVIGALEDAEDDKAFEAAIIADYDAQSAVERELVLGLAGLLWRLRRATTMETGLFNIQADHLNGLRQARQFTLEKLSTRCSGGAEPAVSAPTPSPPNIISRTECITGSVPKSVEEPTVDPDAELARCFLRLANLPNYALDRLSRYEATLWRQAGQILFALDALDRRKPWDRRRGFRSRQEQLGYDPDECYCNFEPTNDNPFGTGLRPNYANAGRRDLSQSKPEGALKFASR